MDKLTCDVLIIGAGPGGYTCAQRCGESGLDTIIVEKATLGGTCLNVGCIPSKAIIHAADEFSRVSSLAGGSEPGITNRGSDIDYVLTRNWKDGIVSRLGNGVAYLLRNAGVRHIQGYARFVDGKTVDVTGSETNHRISALAVVLATGSEPVALDNLPLGPDILTSSGIFDLDHIPEKLAVVGGGYIGIEIGTAFAKLGSNVTIIEVGPRILPGYASALTRPVETQLAELGVELRIQTRVLGTEGDSLRIDNGDLIPFDKVLVAVGRKPVLDQLGLEDLSLAMDGPYLRIDDQCQTSMKGLYAIGDITPLPMLAHKATAQAEIVAANLGSKADGKPKIWDHHAIPEICFSDPEIVSVGLSVQTAKNAGLDVLHSRIPFSGNGRALTMEAGIGFVELVADKACGQVLGIHAVGSHISELAAGFAHAIEFQATVEDICATIHAHPTLGENIHEAAHKLCRELV